MPHCPRCHVLLRWLGTVARLLARRYSLMLETPAPCCVPQALEVASLSKVSPGSTKVIVMDNQVRRGFERINCDLVSDTH